MNNLILICDDDSAVRSSLKLVLKRAGYEVECVENQEECVDFIKKTQPAVILMDMNYTNSTTGEEGLTLLKQVKIYRPHVPIILITAWGSIELAVKGLQAGAFDFVVKPWNNLVLIKSIQTAIQLSDDGESNSDVKSVEDKSSGDFSKIIGRSPLMENIFKTISRIASTNAPVLIIGESGTGKELIAEAIHDNSKRKKDPFVKVNLGGISQTLFESEMFGHKKGAFTDAYYDRVGRFEMADKGSIFLDEIGDLDAICQVKLLRVLQDQTFESLGDSKTKRIDVRVVSATNKNLPEMISQGTFREDLFYRINLIQIQVPALRERREDIPLLVKHFAALQSKINNFPNIEFSSEAITFLQKLPFPGNIRELKNLIDRTILVSGENMITDTDIKAQYMEVPGENKNTFQTVSSLDDMEKQMITKAMHTYGGNLSKVAIALGLTRQALYRRLEKHGINTTEK